MGASTTIGEFLLPKRLARFAQAFPNLKVRLQISNTQEIVQRVLDYSLHLGFVGLRPASASLTASAFLEDEIVLFAAPSYALARRGISARTLSQARLLVREEGSATRTLALNALARCGVATEAAVAFGSNSAVRSAALAGYGVGVLSRHVVEDDVATSRLRLLRLPRWRCRRRFYLIRRRNTRLSRGEERLLAHLHQKD